MRSDHDGNRFVGKSEAIGRTRVEERQDLRRLRRRAQHHGQPGIARRGHRAAPGVDHRESAEMHRFEAVAPAYLDERHVAQLRGDSRDLRCRHAIHLRKGVIVR